MPATDGLKDRLMLTSHGFRHGVVMPPTFLETGPADIPGLFHVGVPQSPATGMESPSGGVGWDRRTAELAGLGEALERYAATVCPLPSRSRDELAPETVLDIEKFALFTAAQRSDPNFPYGAVYRADQPYTNVYTLTDNDEYWAPFDLVPLRSSEQPSVTTSNGLACGGSAVMALLRGLQEIIERDALMVTWLHGIPGRRRPLRPELRQPVEQLGGDVVCIDATPAYSPFPVALVAGMLPQRGRPRISLGAACRATWEAAAERAFLEWSQGIVFAGFYTDQHPDLHFARFEDVKTFDDHAAYFTMHPEHWEGVPLLAGGEVSEPPVELLDVSRSATLREAVRQLAREGVRIYYRDLTTVDLRQLGLTAVRVLSPELTPIFCDQAYPLLGGRTADVTWRYPWAARVGLNYPNPLPHPLG